MELTNKLLEEYFNRDNTRKLFIIETRYFTDDTISLTYYLDESVKVEYMGDIPIKHIVSYLRESRILKILNN